MPFERVVLLIDRMVGGRQRHLTVGPQAARAPRVRTTWMAILTLLALSLLLGTSTLVIAFVLWRGSTTEPFMVWVRGTVVLGLTAGLVYFVWRAMAGFWWAYSRMRLFVFIFPVVSLILVSIPGLYPTWMRVEQVAFAVLILAVGILLWSPWMRSAYRKPAA
ncbi:MAG: hypothetical protein QM607_06580 [Microbacterium sp.]